MKRQYYYARKISVRAYIYFGILYLNQIKLYSIKSSIWIKFNNGFFIKIDLIFAMSLIFDILFAFFFKKKTFVTYGETIPKN
jgi:hypothetical protein